MKKSIYLIVLVLILGLVLTGCSLLSNISQVPTSEQSGITYLTKGPSSDLVGLWHFDTDANDSTAYHNDGMLIGDAHLNTGYFGNAVSFDGTNDYVKIADAPSLNITQGTWEAWIKFDAKPSDVGHPMNPLAKANQYWIHGSLNDLDSNTTDAIVVKICVNGKRYCAKTGSGFIDVDVWYHVAGTYDGQTLNLYVNGTLIDSNEDPSGNIDLKSYIIAVGTWSTLTDYFQGVIDEVRIWNTALTADQLNLYGFNGLMDPYAPPEEKTFKVGRTIPLKWQFTNLLDDSSAAHPSVEIKRNYSGIIPAEGDPFEVDDPGNSGYQYDWETNTWQFNWQTKGREVGLYDIWIINDWTGQTFGPIEICLR